MARLPYLHGTAIADWASRRDAQHTLPRLIRRLVNATAVAVSMCSFRGGEGVQLSGWDGLVVAGSGTTFVPEGTSGWELGTGRDPKAKADADYASRSEDPRGLNPADATFVFVTARRWAAKNEWAQQRRAEAKWLDVRVIDADDIEAWLELAPVASSWFAMQLGYSPGGAVDIETFWRAWADETDPPIPAALVTAGREQIVEMIGNWAAGEESYFSFKTDSREESVVLFAASLEDLDLPVRGSIQARTLVVKDAEAWRELAAAPQDLILVPLFGGNARVQPPRPGQRLVVPLGNADSAAGVAGVVPRISTDRATDIFLGLGSPEDAARQLAMTARRSLASLRRRLAIHREVREPMWARPEHGQSLVPLLIAGAWDESVKGDREVLGELGGATYEEVANRLSRWINEEDPPLRRVGTIWFSVSKEDGWAQLVRYVSDDDWRRLVEIAERVLGWTDGMWDKPADDRWFASVAEPPRYSARLRLSFAETLALLASDGDAIAASQHTSPREWSERATARVLSNARKDWRVWASLGSFLPLLAEAHPDQFLSTVEASVGEPEPVLLSLFEGDHGGITSTPAHVGLLWALENLAWSPQLLTRSTMVLARLAALDPGGKSSNRPINSLGDIFRPWLPQTGADVNQRLAALDRLVERYPDIAWAVMIHMLPTLHAVGQYTHRPRWREWAPSSGKRPGMGEYTSTVNAVLGRLLSEAGDSGERWTSLLEALDGLAPDLRELVVQRLSGVEGGDTAPATKASIWSALRDLVARHRSYPDAQWSLPTQEVAKLAALRDKFEPEDLTARFSWLFADSPRHMEDAGTWEERQESLRRARESAVLRFDERGGASELLALAEAVERPGILGETTGRVGACADEEDELLHRCLAATDAALRTFARGFALGRCAGRGRVWAEQKLADFASTWMPEQQAELLLAMPCDPQTWDLVDERGGAVRASYWRLAYPWTRDSDGLERAIENLLLYDRPFVAADLLGMHLHGSPPTHRSELCDLYARVLEACLSADGEHDRPGAGFLEDARSILDILGDAEFDAARLARIEWGFLRALRFERPPRTLHAELSRSPIFFVEVVASAFRPEGQDESPEDTDSERAARASAAYELLRSWRAVPGSVPGEPIDLTRLKEWVSVARERLAQSNRAAVGDIMLGESLSGAPEGSDGLWPAEAVRDLVELVQSDELERGFETGIANSRGVVSKGLREGGTQERALQARYERLADGVNDDWPRTGAMLRRVAESYRRQADAEDRRAALGEELGL